MPCSGWITKQAWPVIFKMDSFTSFFFFFFLHWSMILLQHPVSEFYSEAIRHWFWWDLACVPWQHSQALAVGKEREKKYVHLLLANLLLLSRHGFLKFQVGGLQCTCFLFSFVALEFFLRFFVLFFARFCLVLKEHQDRTCSIFLWVVHSLPDYTSPIPTKPTRHPVSILFYTGR